MRPSALLKSTWNVRAFGAATCTLAVGAAGVITTACGTGDDVTAAVPMADAGASMDATSVSDAITAAASDATGSGDHTSSEAASGGDSSASDATAPSDAVGVPPDAFAPVPPIYAAVRLANWSVDSPAVDVCIAPTGTTTFMGPLIGNANATLDGGPVLDDGGPDGPGLAFPQISTYLNITPGTYTARLVVAGAADCSGGLGTDLPIPALAAGSLDTVALIGEAHPTAGGPALKFATFSDVWPMQSLVTPPTDGGGLPLALRIINASSIPLLDVGSGMFADKTFSLIFSGVPFGQAGVPTGKQVQGVGSTYAVLSPLTAPNQSISAHAYGSAVDGVTARFFAPGGAAITVIVIPPNPEADAGAPSQILECVDNGGIVGAMAACTTLTK